MLRALALALALMLALPVAASAQAVPLRNWAYVVYNYNASQYDKRSGDSGDFVRQIQNRLYALGYLDGARDGEYGSTTRAAVESFQRNNGIHGYSENYGIATQLTQAVLFSDYAISWYDAPRLSSWSVNYTPYSVKVGHYIENTGYDSYELHFRLENENPSRKLMGFVLRYWLEDSAGYLVKYNGYEVYQTTVDISDGLGSGDITNVTIYLADGISSKAVDLRWTITELAYDNGEVYMDYDATERSYGLSSYTTYF